MGSTQSNKHGHATDIAENAVCASMMPLALVIDPIALTFLDITRVTVSDTKEVSLHLSSGQLCLTSLTERRTTTDSDHGASPDDAKNHGIQLRRDESRNEAMATQVALIRTVFDKLIESVREVQHQASDSATVDQFIRHVAEKLAQKEDISNPRSDAAWQQLLERGMQSKTALLKSSTFKTVLEASELSGVKDAAIRKRIREGKLFALKNGVDGEYRIPAWALDPQIAGAATAAFIAAVRPADDWSLYAFLSNANGSLNGLRPFECLLSEENLPPDRKALRDALKSYLKLPAKASLFEVVHAALVEDISEGQYA